MTTDGGEAASALEARARSAVEAIPAETLAGARWSGLRGRPVRSVEIVDVFAFADGGILALLEVTPRDGSEPARLTLPIPEAEPWTGLHRLAAQGGTVAGTRGGRLVGHPGRKTMTSAGTATPEAGAPASGAPASIRRAPGDQSHTSVIVGGDSILKLYRRLTPGPNPEAEILAALAAVADAPVPPWRGEVDLVHADGHTTAVAIEQAFIAGAPDAFELLADGLSAWLAGGGPPVPTAVPAGTGIAAGRLHVALGQLDGPGFAPRAATVNDRAAWHRTAEAGIGAAINAVAAADPELAAEIERAVPAIRLAILPLGDPATPVRLQRIHGDLHLGQVLPTARAVLLVDFEGDPVREPGERRALGAPLRDVAGFLRSIDHVARSGWRRAGLALGRPLAPGATVELESWIASARAAFLAGYATGLGRPGWMPDAPLLRALEVEKELHEFVYAARYLPAWLYAPAGGLRGLIGPVMVAEGGA